jgi:Zn-dependent protease
MPFSVEFIEMLYRLPALLVSLTLHELAHGYISFKNGDPTAKNAGRLTLNPLKHLDPIGTLMLLFGGFGFAKPVPINPSYYKNKKLGLVTTSIAGPLVNMLLAILFSILFVLTSRSFIGINPAFDRIGKSFKSMIGLFLNYPASDFVSNGMTYFQANILILLSYFVIINIGLAIFNLLPIPPLDGSKVLFPALPERIYFKYILPYERYGMFVLLALMFTGVVGRVMNPLVNAVLDFFNTALKFI